MTELRIDTQGRRPRRCNPMFSISKSLYDLVDEFEGIFPAFLGKMHIDNGGHRLGMGHVSLDKAQIDPGFEQIGNVGVAWRLDGDVPFADAGFHFSFAKTCTKVEV
jgi:hypothetical protein